MRNGKCLAFYISPFVFVSFFILNFTFYIPFALAETQPQDVVEVSPFCFRRDECQTYNASPSPYEAPECKNPSPGHNARAVELEYKFNCYANQRPTKLQVSIGGYEVPGIEEYIKRLYIYLISIVGIVAGIMYVWAGTKWLTSAGAPERITDAKKKIGNASVGLVLVLASYLILQLVNPALVELKLPPVKIVRRDLGETQEWCVKRTEFPCGGNEQHTDGQWDCSDPAYLQANPSNPPCGQPKGGKCYGQYCAEGGCQRLVMDRVLGGVDGALMNRLRAISRKCVNPTDCNNCNIPFPYSPNVDTTGAIIGYDIEKMSLCISSACNCRIEGRQRTADITGTQVFDPYCTALKNPGEQCNADAECKSGNCNRAGLHRCTQQGGDPNGTTCGQDEDCRSGICFISRGSAGSGNFFSQCVAPRSRGEDEECSDDRQCRSGLSCYAWNRIIIGTSARNLPFGASVCQR